MFQTEVVGEVNHTFYVQYTFYTAYPPQLEIKFKEYVIPFSADSRGI
jgi:hypothetical protein